MKLSAWGHSDVGRMRDHNEDAIVVDGPLQLFLVADGVGGRQAGEVAAAMVASHVHQRFRAFHAEHLAGGRLDEQTACDLLTKSFTQWLDEACEAIFNDAQQNAVRQGMKTTATIFCIYGSRGVIGHVGDCRLYLIRGGRPYQLTKDHTLLQMYLDLGVLTPDQAATFKHRHVLSHSIGGKPAVETATSIIDVLPDDRFVLCSDGLTDVVNPDTIRDIVLQQDYKAATRRLIELANSRGGRDNVTVAVIAAEGQPDHTASKMRTDQRIELLKGIAIFDDLSFQERLRILSIATDIRVSDGSVIVREGEYGQELYVVLHGNVLVTRHGRELNRLAAGQHFGELALITDGWRSATITSVGDSHHLRIKRDDLVGLVRNDPVLGVKLLWPFLQNMGNRVRALSDQLTLTR